jgi:hypothetical protein
LPNGTINASENQLESASSSCERWEWGCAGAVVVALVAEFAIAAIHPPYDSFLEQWGTAIADTVIALGIVGEVLFSRKDARIQTELRNRSNAKLADAIRRAAKAEFDLAILRLQTAPRQIDPAKFLAPLAKAKKPAKVELRYQKDWPEPWSFAEELFTYLNIAGWNPSLPIEIGSDDKPPNSSPPMVGPDTSGILLLTKNLLTDLKDPDSAVRGMITALETASTLTIGPDVRLPENTLKILVTPRVVTVLPISRQ